MPLYLTNDPGEIWRATGFDAHESSLPPKLAVDGFRSAMPLMATGAGDLPLLFFREIDRTNVERLGMNRARLVWYAPYFTFGGLREPTDAYPDLAAALAAQLAGRASLDPKMTVELYRAVEAAVETASPLEAHDFHAPRHHYVVDRADVQSAFAPGRMELAEAAGPLVAELDRNRIEPWLARPPDDGFDVLDRLLEEAGLDAVLAASPLAIQELTGVPMRSIGAHTWALYPARSDVIHLLTQSELPRPRLPSARPAGPESVRALAGGTRIGFEEVALSVGAWAGFGLDALESRPATALLRRWRELRSWVDVASYIVGARVTLDAIRAALSYVEGELEAERPVAELDAYERYRLTVESTIRERSLPIRVRTYFTHTHAGDRSHFPASATEHGVTARSSLKIDGGLEIYDSRGMFVGVSDITRSAVGSGEAKEFYKLLDSALIEGAIASCRPGVKGGDVFAAGLSYLEPYRDDIVSGGLMPASDAPMTELFARNIGHLINKQEPATLEFRSGDQASLEAGMVAAAEFQWPYANYCIGVEDIFLITDGEPVNLTRPI